MRFIKLVSVLLPQVQVNGIQSTTEDNDVILENNMFESRQVFLCFSQKHNYNFDRLRRAKHSSMMILHHLHTSSKHLRSQNSSRVLQVTCTTCNKDVSTTIYFSCLICSNYRACTGCYNENKILRQLHLFPIIPSAHGTPPRTVGVSICSKTEHCAVSWKRKQWLLCFFLFFGFNFDQFSELSNLLAGAWDTGRYVARASVSAPGH